MKRRKGGPREPLGLDKEEDCVIVFCFFSVGHTGSLLKQDCITESVGVGETA